MCTSFFRSLIIAVAAFLCGASGLSGQTRFARPDTTPNYAAYRYPEECMSAVIRLSDSSDTKQGLWRDTMSFGASLVPRPRPPAAIEASRKCFTKVDVDSIGNHAVAMWASFLVTAQRNDEAERLLTRYLDSAKFGALVGRMIFIGKVYQKARPANYAMIKKFSDNVKSRIPDDSLLHSLWLNNELYGFAVSAGAFEDAEHIESEAKQLLTKWKGSKEGGFEARKLFSRPFREEFSDAGFDSLLVSTTAFRNLRMHTWRTYIDEDAQDAAFVEGMKVPSLEGDWYYTNNFKTNNHKLVLSDQFSKISATQRPVPGKVNAVAFVQGGCHEGTLFFSKAARNNGLGRRNCWPTIASLKRLKNQFPDLEITIVTKTYGDYANATPLKPADEADTLASYFLGFYQIPAVHVIANGEFVRIPGLDNRRVDTEVPFEYAYEIDGVKLAQDGIVLLIDETGHIFHVDGIVGYNEVRARKKIETVYKRLQQESQHASQHTSQQSAQASESK